MVKCMKKILKVLCLCLICVVCALGFSACGGDKEKDITYMEKHEIELTMDNYWYYFDVKTSIANYTPPYEFTGCLSYAYYDNVCVSFECTKSGSTEIYVVKLKANGEGVMPFISGTSVHLLDITGKVIFWM